MWTRFALVLACCLAKRAAAEPPKLEDALATAARNGHPLVVEIGATWCLPCREFEQHVLPRPEVVRALEGIDLVRYDMDEPTGDHVARRYNVTTVPTFLVIGIEGRALVHTTGVPHDPITAARWFVQLLDDARAHGQSTAELEARVADHPDRADLRLALARHLHAIGRTPEAIQQLQAIVALPQVARDLEATAADELDRISSADARVTAALDAARAFVTRYPDSPLASPKLALLAVSGRVPARDLAQLAHAHVEQIDVAHLPDAVRASVIAGRIPEAQHALARAIAKQATIDLRLLEVETLFAAARTDEARRRLSALCAKPVRGSELACLSLEAMRGHESPLIERMRSSATTYLAALDDPGHEEVALVHLATFGDRTFGNAVARALYDARERCGDLALRAADLTIGFDLRPARTRPAAVFVRSVPRDAELDRCFEERLTVAELPPSPRVDGGLYARMHVERSTSPRARTAERRSTSRAAVYAIARSGALDSGGAGFLGERSLVRFGDSALIGGVQAEVAAAHDDFATYAGRALVGFGVPAGRARVSLTAGLGASTYGEAVPLAVELPLEMRVSIDLGPVRGHVWARAALVLGEASRADDEVAAGLGTSIPIAGHRVLVGAGAESRSLGTNVLVLAGIPLGDF
ncbi:MAG TPA: tetratricopeptide repeat protein [Kofleriaceae bacterium]|nr:tetratricopeptide repeat protein [Kofleriaceae bacterium]